MEDLIEKKDGELLQKHACDSSDYLIAVACGAVSGLVDIFLVGAPSQSVIGKWTDAQVDEAVKKFAEKSGWSPRPGKEGNVASAIDILCDCIQQAPYSTILYVHLYNLFTGRKSDIHSAAKFFGNERNYKLSLLSADKKIVDSIKTEPEKTVEEIRKKIESYETLARDNPYLNVATYVKALEKKAIA